MNKKYRVFLFSKRTAIDRILFTLGQSEAEPCYPTKIHWTMTDSSYRTVYDAIQCSTTMAGSPRLPMTAARKPISLTDDGTMVFTALIDFMGVLDADEPRLPRSMRRRQQPTGCGGRSIPNSALS